MEIRKIGYVAAFFTIVIGIVLFLITTGKIEIDTSEMMLGQSSFALFSISGVLIFFGFCLLTNMEHQIVAIVDIIMAFLYAGIVVLFMIMPPEDAKNNYKIILWGSIAAGALVAATVPFLVRTQSKFHRYFKYGVTGIILITTFLGIGLINSLQKVKDFSDLEAIQKNSQMVEYGVLASVLGILCNPMIAYASSDGLGGGGSSSSTKLVPKNAATDPNMSDGVNPNQGINYGEMPVPEGVVANPSPEVASPVPEPVAPETPVVPVTPSVPVSPEVSPIPTTTPVAAPVAEPAVAPAPVSGASINANEVAPELQFLLNNNNNK